MRKVVILFGTLGAFSLAVGIVMASGGYSVLKAAQSRDVELSRARLAGVPLSPLDMARQPIPESQNAAGPFKNAIEEADGKYAKQFVALRQGRDKNPTAYDRAFAEARPVFDSLRLGVERPHCDFGYDWKAFPVAPAPRVIELANISEVLCGDAENRSKSGDVVGALASIGTAAGVANRLGEEPFLIAALVQSAIRDRAMNAAQTVFESHGLEPRCADGIRTVLDSLGPAPDLRPVLTVEALYAIASASSNAVMPDPIVDTGHDRSARLVQRIPLFGNAFQSEAASHWATVLGSLPRDSNDLRGVVRALAAGDHDLTRRNGFADELLHESGIGFRVQYDRIVDVETRRRIMVGAIDRIRKPGGAVPADPLGSGPTSIGRADGRTILYSVGPNGIDDGGKNDDIVVRLPEPV